MFGIIGAADLPIVQPEWGSRRQTRSLTAFPFPELIASPRSHSPPRKQGGKSSYATQFRCHRLPGPKSMTWIRCCQPRSICVLRAPFSARNFGLHSLVWTTSYACITT